MAIQKSTKVDLRYEQVPDIIQYIGGEFTPAISAIWEGHDLGEYLMSSLAQRHVWHAVLTAPSYALPPMKERRNWLTKSRRKDLLRAAFGTCPPGMIRLLSKLDPRAESADFYRAVHSALSRGDVLSRILQHAHTIDRRVIFGIAGLPTDKLAVRMASYSLRHSVSDLDIEELSWLGGRIADFDQSGNALDTVYRSSNPLVALRKAIANLPFPGAPWTASGLLPISSGEELSDIARRFDNCLADRDLFYSSCVDVHAGIAYYYRTLGDDHLLVKFSKFASLGWYLDECRGPNNRRPTEQEADSLTKAVSHLDGIWCRRLSYQIR